MMIGFLAIGVLINFSEVSSYVHHFACKGIGPMYDYDICSKIHHQASFAQNYSHYLDVKYCSHVGILFKSAPWAFG